jgi:hypothetical protein
MNTANSYTIVGFKDFNHDEKLFVRPNTVMLLKMPDTITSVGTYTFNNESKLRHIVLSDALTNIKNNAFIRTGLVEVNIPNSVISIGDSAFVFTYSLQTVTFEDNIRLESIGYEAFANSSITSFKLVNDVNIIGKRVFAGANNLTTIEIVEASNNYSLVDGVLFSKDGQTLICYPGGKTNTTYEIPNSVVTIDSSAFYKNTHLNEITFGSNPSLETIGLGAFSNSSISKFTIPSTVNAIGLCAFELTQLEYIIIPSGVNSVGMMAFMVTTLNIFMDREDPPTSWGMLWNGDNNVYYLPNWTTDENEVPYVITVNVTKPSTITCVNEDLEGKKLTAGTQVEFQTTAPEGKEVDAVVINGNYTYPTVSNNKFTITVPTADFTLAVTFKNIIYTLSYVIDDGEYDVFTFQQNYIHNDPNPITNTYIVDETGITDWKYDANGPHPGETFIFGGTYDYLQNITLRKTVTPLSSDKLACDLNYDQGTATITEIDNPVDQTVIILPNIYLYGTVEYTIVGFKDFGYWDCLFTNQNKVMLLKMPNTITSVGTYTFNDESKLRHISLSDALQTIGESAFYGATGLVEINIPNTVISIGNFAFYGATNLQTVTFEDNSGLDSIGNYALASSGIASFKLANDINIIGKNVLAGTNNLTTIEIIENSANYSLVDGVLFSKDGQTLICYPGGKTNTTYEIPNSVVTIDSCAFDGNTHLNEITFGSNSSLTTIGRSAFIDSSLTKITIPNKVTTIDDLAFGGTQLTYIIIPSKVNYVGDMAFVGSNLNIFMNRENPPDLWGMDWNGCNPVYYLPNWATGDDGVPYVITVNVTKPSTITCVVESLEGKKLTAGTQVQFKITPPTGQVLKTLTLNIDGVTSSPYVSEDNTFTVNVPAVDFSLYATFEYIPYTLSYSINGGQFIITQEVHYGQDVLDAFIKEEAGDLTWHLGGSPVTFPYPYNHTENKTFTATVGSLAPQYIEAGATTITKINNPENVKVVIIPAGYSCTANLTNESNLFLNPVHYVAFPNDGLFDQIGGYTFNNQDVRKVILPNSGDLNIIGAYAFNECKYLTNITISTAVAILEGAFKGTTSLEEVIFAEGSSLTQIGNYAFANSGITKFKLKNNVDVVGKNAFYGTENLTEFEIEPGSEVYFVDEAKALYTYDKTKLIAYPGARTDQSYNMRSETQIIDVGAFMGNKYLQTIGIGSNFTTISNDAFNNAVNFSSIVYQEGANLTTFGKRAFKNTKLNITDIHPKIRTISEETFSNISNMQYVVIPFPSNIETIEANAFYSEEPTLRIYVNSTEPNVGWETGWDNGVLGVHYNPNWEYQVEGPCYKTVSATLPDTIALTDTNLNIDELMAGSQVEFKITPPPGEEVETVTMTVEGENSYPLVSNDKFTINIPAVDFTLSVTFKYIPYYITYSINGGLFTITKEVHYGQDVAKTFIDDEVGELTWYLDGEAVPFPYQYNHTEDKIFTAEVAPIDQSYITATISSNAGNEFATITSIDVFYSGIRVVIIPEYYNEHPVKVIGNGSNTIFNYIANYVALPNTVTEIANNAFKNQDIKQIKLSNYLTTIGNFAFLNCRNLKTITIPNTVATIGDNAFSYTDALTEVIFQDGSQLLTIGNRAFAGSKITKFKLANNVDIVGKNIFNNCQNLIEFEIEPGSTVYSLDDGVLYSANGKTLIACPNGKEGTYAVKANTVTIGEQAFFSNTKLIEITIPTTVTTISAGAFSCMPHLERVNIGEGTNLTTIGNFAFMDANLTSFTIPNTVTSIGDSAFKNLRSNLLSYMVIPNNVETLGKDIFDRFSNKITIYVELESQPAEGWDASWANGTADVHYLPNWEYNGETGIPHYKTVNVALPDTITLVDNNLDNTQLIAGKDVEFNIAIPTGKRIKTLTVNGNGITVVDNKFTIKIVHPTTTLFLEYEYVPYYITYSINGGLLTITEEVHYGKSVAKTFINDETGNLTWLLDGSPVTFPYPYNHTENKTFTTVVDPIAQSYITATISGDAGSEIATITSIDNFSAGIKVIIIPTYYNGYPIKVIGNGSDEIFNGEANYVALPNTVTEIANNAFYSTQSLRQIKLSNSLTTIGTSAFQNCAKLKTITIPNTVTTIESDAFTSTSALEEVIFQDGSQLETIGSYAFNGSKITKFKLANNVNIVGKSIFNNCLNLIEFEIEPNSTVYSLDDGVLYSANGKNLIAYPTGKKDISYTVKANTEVIETLAFRVNSYLNEVNIPNTVKHIRDGAFFGTTNLQTVTFEDNSGLLSIGYEAFSNSGITSFKLANDVNIVGKRVFIGANNLTTIEIVENSNNYSLVGGVLFSKDGQTLIYYPGGKTDTTYQIPNSVVIIGDFAFYKNTRLNEITFGSNPSLTTIGESAFSESSISKFTIPNTVTSIKFDAFYNTSLTYIIIPSGVTEIKTYAFASISGAIYVDLTSAPDTWDEGWNGGTTVYYKPSWDTDVDGVPYLV